MKPLDGLTALVTGASSGIGRGIALRFAEAGARVAVNYCHNQDGAEETARRIRDGGGEARVVQADVGVAKDVSRMFEEVDCHFGKLGVLVNNAGVTLKAPLLDTTEEDFDAVFRTNLKGVFFCSQHAARRMRAAGGGAILNISSVHAARTTYDFGAYAATKGGIESLTRSAAIEWGPFGIRVNALRVGLVSVERDSMSPQDPRYGAVCNRLPVGRPGEVDDIAPLALLLCSPSAAFVSGAVVDIDGGVGAMLNTPFERGFVEV